jgi:hypothetical protein
MAKQPEKTASEEPDLFDELMEYAQREKLYLRVVGAREALGLTWFCREESSWAFAAAHNYWKWRLDQVMQPVRTSRKDAVCDDPILEEHQLRKSMGFLADWMGAEISFEVEGDDILFLLPYGRKFDLDWFTQDLSFFDSLLGWCEKHGMNSFFEMKAPSYEGDELQVKITTLDELIDSGEVSIKGVPQSGEVFVRTRAAAMTKAVGEALKMPRGRRG